MQIRAEEGVRRDAARRDNRFAAAPPRREDRARHELVGHRLREVPRKRRAVELIEQLNVKPPYPQMQVAKFSGGNQQKVVVAKWLATDPKVLIVDEPTNGIDVGAKTEIHALLRKLADDGMAVIMVSSELPEILSISDRVLVMRRGRINGEFDGGTVTQEMIMEKAVLSTGQKGA